MGFFITENKAMQLLDTFFDYLQLLLFTLVFSIPVITIGPALTAKHYTAMKIARKESPNVMQSFLKSFKENLKQGILLELILLAAGAVIAADWYIVWHLNLGLISYVLLSVIVVVTLMTAIICEYSFALLARFNAGTLQVLKCSLMIGTGRFGISLLLLLCNIAVICACFIWYLYAVFIWLIAGALILSVKSHLFTMVFRKFED